MAKDEPTAQAGADTNTSSNAGKGQPDPGARNLALLVIVAIGCLVCFLLYLVRVSLSDAAPTVIAPSLSPAERNLFTTLTPAERHRVSEASKADGAAEGAASDSPESASDGNGGNGDGAEDDEAIEKRVWDPRIVQRGQYLYRAAGCSLCHGREGKGGVTNPNYTKETFPPLSNMAEKLSLEFPEDADVVIDMLLAGQSLDDPSKIDIPDTAGLVSAKYKIVATVIHDGNPAAKKDLNGQEPIFMPSYKTILSDTEMRQIIASFLIMYPIEEETWEDEANP